jgi:hypothetical protein
MPDPDISAYTDLALQELVDSGVANSRFTASAKVELERRRRKYAEERDREQLNVARAAARAAKWAAGAAVAAALGAIVQAGFLGLQWRETREETFLATKPQVDFDAEYDSDEPMAGIAITNAGPGPASIKAITFYVDRKPVADADEMGRTYAKLPVAATYKNLRCGSKHLPSRRSAMTRHFPSNSKLTWASSQPQKSGSHRTRRWRETGFELPVPRQRSRGEGRIADFALMEKRVEAALPPGTLTPRKLGDGALGRVAHAPQVLVSVQLEGVTYIAPVWRVLDALADVDEIAPAAGYTG